MIKILLLLLLSSQCFAGNWYVRKSAAGSNNGRDWNNAWNEIDQINFTAVACGDTVWLAGGTYTTALTISKTCMSGSPLKIYRVLSTDPVPVAAAGWNSAFDTKVILNNVPISINASAYNIISGRVAYGIQVARSTGGTAVSSPGSGTADHITVAYVELYGPPCVDTHNCTGSAAYGLNLNFPGIIQNSTFDHVYIHRWCEAIRMWNAINNTVQYSQIDDVQPDGIDHEDTLYTAPPNDGITLRYNTISNVPNDGIFIETGSGTTNNFKLYGNVFYASHNSLLTFKSGTFNNVYIVNNTFTSPDGPCNSNCAFISSGNGPARMNNCIVENNVFYNVTNNMGGCQMDHNGYNFSTLNGFRWPFREGGAFNTVSSASFAKFSSNNLHLVFGSVLRDKGVALAVEFNIDMDGNKRGADGRWDVGAFEFTSTAAASRTRAVTGH